MPATSWRRTWPTSSATPEPHAQLFESFALAAGATPDAPATPSTAALLAVVRTTASNDPVAALAMVAAYEVQAADIAASKGDGLRRHYGFDEEGTRFWDVHRTQEVDHAGWSMEALTALGRRPRRGAGGGDGVRRLVVAVPQRARRAGARRRPLLTLFS